MGSHDSPTSEGYARSKREPSTAPSAQDDADAPPRKKKVTGNRGVANLTPEQLAKKRANDREAQRAIRERTKNQIETLERRIEELTSQQPYQELQTVIRAKEAVEKENADIKRRLSSVMAVLQSIVGSPSLANAYVSPVQTQATPVARAASQKSTSTYMAATTSSPSATASPASLDHASSGPSMEYAKNHLSQQQYELRHGLDLGPERLGLNFLLDPDQRVSRIPSGEDGAQDSPRYQHVPMKHDWTATSHEQVHDPRLNTGWTSSQARKVGLVETPPSINDKTGEYSQAIRNSPPSCPLDSLLLDFLSERRQRVAEGLSPQEVVGPRYPSVSSLLNPANSKFSHPLSKVFTDILSTFPDLSALPERVAVLYIMFLVMRWQISPTEENYSRLPEWMRPTQSQIYKHHPAWIDHLPWPQMRDRIIASGGDKVPFENFFIPFTTTLSVSWPYHETDALLKTPDSEELVINPVFERHLRTLANWKLGESFAQALPELADTCRHDGMSVAYRGTRQ